MEANEESKQENGSSEKLNLREIIEATDSLGCRIYANLGNFGKSLTELYQASVKYSKLSDASTIAGREFYHTLAKTCSYVKNTICDEELVLYMLKISQGLVQIQDLQQGVMKLLTYTLAMTEQSLEQEWKTASENYSQYSDVMNKTHQKIHKMDKARKKKKKSGSVSSLDNNADFEIETSVVNERMEVLIKAIRDEQSIFFEHGKYMNQCAKYLRHFYIESELLLRGNISMEAINFQHSICNSSSMSLEKRDAVLFELERISPSELAAAGLEKKYTSVDSSSNSAAGLKVISSSVSGNMKRSASSSVIRSYLKLDEKTIKAEVSADGIKARRLSMKQQERHSLQGKENGSVHADGAEISHSSSISSKHSNDTDASESDINRKSSIKGSDQELNKELADAEVLDSSAPKSTFWNKFRRKISGSNKLADKKKSIKSLPTSSENDVDDANANSAVSDLSALVDAISTPRDDADVITSKSSTFSSSTTAATGTADAAGAVGSAVIFADDDELAKAKAASMASETDIQSNLEVTDKIQEQDEINYSQQEIESQDQTVTAGTTKIELDESSSEAAASESAISIAKRMGTEGAEVLGVHRLEDEISFAGSDISIEKAKKPGVLKRLLSSRSSKAAAAAERTKNMLDKKTSQVDMAALCGIVEIVSYRLTVNRDIDKSWIPYGIQGISLPPVTPILLNEEPLKFMVTQSVTVS